MWHYYSAEMIGLMTQRPKIAAIEEEAKEGFDMTRHNTYTILPLRIPFENVLS